MMASPDQASREAQELLAEAIAAEAQKLGIGIPPVAAPPLAAYATSLWAWNEKLNLTRHTDVERFVSRDLGDAAAVMPHLAHGERILDVGTGGGTPGVILAILRPDLRVELCESVAKKARAVSEIVRETGLAIPVHAAAAQEIVAKRPSGPNRFDTLVVRAVAPLIKLLGWFEPIAQSYGRLLVIKGPRWTDELAEAQSRGLAKKVAVRPVATWPLRGTDNESVLLEVR